MDSNKISIKLNVVGDSRVGKRSILIRYLKIFQNFLKIIRIIFLIY